MSELRRQVRAQRQRPSRLASGPGAVARSMVRHDADPQAARRSQRDELADYIAAFATCPGCGSTKTTDHD